MTDETKFFRVRFKCPECDHTQIDETAKVQEHAPVNVMTDDGHICEYGTASHDSIMGEVASYKCGACGWKPPLEVEDNGVDSVTSALLKWLKENNMLEDA